KPNIVDTSKIVSFQLVCEPNLTCKTEVARQLRRGMKRRRHLTNNLAQTSTQITGSPPLCVKNRYGDKDTVFATHRRCHQISFKPNWICRDVVAVLVIKPPVGTTAPV